MMINSTRGQGANVLHQGMSGYILVDNGELACLEVTVEFLEQNEYEPTEETGEIGSISERVKVRGWVSPVHPEVIWLPEMEA